jgi:hypothetical protein
MREIITDRAVGCRMQENALRYADDFSWKNQTIRHFELAERICRSRVDGWNAVVTTSGIDPVIKETDLAYA